MCFLQCHIISFSVNTAFPLHNSGGSEATNNTYTKNSHQLSILMLFFFNTKQLSVEQPNWYYHQYLDTSDKGQSPPPDMALQVTNLFLSITVQEGIYDSNTLKVY